jgi:hypothetical protein
VREVIKSEGLKTTHVFQRERGHESIEGHVSFTIGKTPSLSWRIISDESKLHQMTGKMVIADFDYLKEMLEAWQNETLAAEKVKDISFIFDNNSGELIAPDYLINHLKDRILAAFRDKYLNTPNNYTTNVSYNH